MSGFSEYTGATGKTSFNLVINNVTNPYSMELKNVGQELCPSVMTSSNDPSTNTVTNTCLNILPNMPENINDDTIINPNANTDIKICKTGSVAFSNGFICVDSDPVCGANGLLDSNNNCIIRPDPTGTDATEDNGTFSCNDGVLDNNDNKCYTCPSGFVYNKNKKCYPDWYANIY